MKKLGAFWKKYKKPILLATAAGAAAATADGATGWSVVRAALSAAGVGL